MGKTALMERLFNITFSNSNSVIPFYYEIKESNIWIVDFCQDFFLTFIYQYIAFKTRKPEYLNPIEKSDFGRVADLAKEEGLDYLTGIIDSAAHAAAHEKIDTLWNIVREAPKTIAARHKEFIVQMIDEFQFLNAMVYRDRGMKTLAKNMAGAYLSTAESKIAPLLVSGTWGRWPINDFIVILHARLQCVYLENVSGKEPEKMGLEI